MRKLHITSWVVFLIGFFFKLLHFDGADILLILGSLLLVIHGVIYALKNADTNLPLSFLHLSLSFWAVHALFRFQFWPSFYFGFGLYLIFAGPLSLTLTCFVMHLKGQLPFRAPQIALAVIFVLSLILNYSQTSTLYYFLNLNAVLNGESRVRDYRSWDKYSWLLYSTDEFNAAADANQKAQKAVGEYLKLSPDREAFQHSALIKQHEQQIHNKTWETYP
jgi:hypothetical protein